MLRMADDDEIVDEVESDESWMRSLLSKIDNNYF